MSRRDVEDDIVQVGSSFVLLLLLCDTVDPYSSWPSSGARASGTVFSRIVFGAM